MALSRYIIRFDDICPGMNWQVWESIEAMLCARAVKPILAVVPDNRDPQLDVGPKVPDFWDRVRRWQSWGWTIGLHGYQHVYETEQAGLLGLNTRSEFAGLPRESQALKLDKALDIFRRERVRPDCWVAPGHSFDRVTTDLLRERGVSVISDGFFRRVVRRDGCTWVPQQLWRFRKVGPGLWTVCFHHNSLSADGLERLKLALDKHAGQLTDLESSINGAEPAYDWKDRLTEHVWLAAVRARRRLAQGRG